MYLKTVSSMPGVARANPAFLKNSTVLFSAIAAFLFVVSCCIIISLRLNDGIFIYPLDDTYIHMTIAKNLALHGTWGMDPKVFASASSSILYTLLLASSFYIVGVNSFVPLVLNLSAALLVIWYFYRVAQLRNVNPLYLFFILVLVVGGVSMIPLTISGMEHTWQILTGLLFVYESSRHIEAGTRQLSWRLLLLSALVTMIRYEGVFLVGIISFLMLLRGQRWQAVLTGVAGFLPIFIFGVYSLSHGGYFVPNSLLLKGQIPDLSVKGLYMLCVGWMIKLVQQPHLFLLFTLLCLILAVSLGIGGNKWKLENIISGIVVSLFITHLTFAETGWFYRYEAYLMAFSFFAFMIVEKRTGPLLSALSVRYLSLKLKTVLIILALPLMARGLYTIWNTPLAMNNIYCQQYQMATFIHHSDPGIGVVANDIGAISYYNNPRLLDVFGLASRKVLDLKRAGNLNKASVEALASSQHMRVALVYDYDRIIPDSWIRIGEWTIPHNVVCEKSTVAVYLTGMDGNNQRVIDSFNAFANTLPKGVRYKVSFP
jgi:hypothetical protein